MANGGPKNETQTVVEKKIVKGGRVGGKIPLARRKKPGFVHGQNNGFHVTKSNGSKGLVDFPVKVK